MSRYLDMSKEQLSAELEKEKDKFAKLKAKGLKLDMSRGKPSAQQLDLCMELLDTVNGETGCKSEEGIDCRNYGTPDGIVEARRLFSEILDTSPENIVIGGNSSLNMMFDFISQCMTHGTGGCKPWAAQGEIKFICPAPGYDRHFAICEYFGIKMIPVAMMADGPDMDEVERLISDSSVKGMWCVPKYSNPQGITYSDAVVKRIAAMRPAAKDFRVMWDNAYSVHHVGMIDEKLLPILEECKNAGNPDMVVNFASTSKITFPGGGIAAVAANKGLLSEIKNRMKIQTICADKVNQLRHAKMFPNISVLEEHMKKHSAVLSPKFDMINDILTKEISDAGILGWTRPNGGYFISVDTLPGCAKRTVELCAEGGVVMTGAGATYPYGKDPLDSNIRIAPSFPPLEELRLAMELFVIAVKIASAEMLMNQ